MLRIALVSMICVVAVLTVVGKAEERVAAEPFKAGMGCAQVYGSYMSDLGNRDVRFGGPQAGVGYYFVDGMAINVEGAAYRIDQPGEDVWGGNLGILLRHHLVQWDRVSVYVDVGVAAFEAMEDVPPGGTRLTIYTRVGPGFLYPVDKNMYLMGGVRGTHLSNARSEGEDRNPSLNGVEGYVGLLFAF